MCPGCYWKDDAVQTSDIEYGGGANDICLREARENYQKFGASSIAVKAHTRLPLDSERP